jgi:hypothetical protein
MDFSNFYIQNVLQKRAIEKIKKYEKKYENLEREIQNPIECSCNKREINAKSSFTPMQARKIFLKIYRFNDTRCIICKSNYIYYASKYPIMKKDDIININGILTANSQIKQINFTRPIFLTGIINYDYYGNVIQK